jgi:hypothetical protein
MAPEKHDTLETWQIAVGIATGLVGLFYYARKPAPETAEPAATTVGPSGLGEAAGGGGAGGTWPTPGQPASPTLTGQQSPGGKPKPRTPEELIGAGAPAPGESLGEWERSHHGPVAHPGSLIGGDAHLKRYPSR